ncbi:MAG: T9SS type A sorting domain-containing protein, partial [Flavobacteriales bacterium]
NFYQVLGACNVGLEEQEFEKEGILLFPNPAVSYSTIRLNTENEWVKIEIQDLDGRIIKEVADSNMDQGIHHIQFEIGDLKPGQYIVLVKKRSGFKRAKLMKLK